MSQQISLRIHRVMCIDETGGKYAEKFGNDEISLGGFSISSNGDTQVIAPWDVYKSFDDSDKKDFNPPRVFHTFALAPAGFPQEVALGLVLAEKDIGGGMTVAIKDIAKLVSEQLKAHLALHPVPAAAVGAVLVPVLIYALKAIAAAIAAEVKRRIIKASKDDVFPPEYVTMSVSGPNMRFDGSTSSVLSTLRFEGHEGIYDLTYDWQVAGGAEPGRVNPAGGGGVVLRG